MSEARPKMKLTRATMKIKPVVAWYDMWIGAYWDRAGRRLYILPLPCLGIVIQFDPQREDGEG